jgi:hypothetical protein
MTMATCIKINENCIESLCLQAINAKDFRASLKIIEDLKRHKAEAGKFFKMYAQHSRNPSERSRALLFLGMIGCDDALDFVWDGLMDMNRTVRMTAALNVGLYDDGTIARVIDLMIEKGLL